MPTATLTSTQVGSSEDYYKYLYDSPVKTDQIGDPDTLEFTLAGTDSDFVRLNRGAYITASSSSLKDSSGNSVNWFTGYVAYDPEYTYLGVHPTTGEPTFTLKYTAMSDEYILSQQSIGIIPPFINMTQGQILSALAERLLPGMFDTSGVQDGLFLARYVVDPTQNYADIVKSFSQAAVYRFWGRDKKLYFTPQDTSLGSGTATPVIVDGHDKHFTPSQLSIRATQQTILNDAVVLGATEPQEYVTEYFIGDGTSSQFPMMESAFGVESAVYLDDDFSENQIDSSKWTVYDSPSNFLQASSGYLNVLGGPQDGTLSVHLDSANLVPVAGNMSITHGDFDFLDAGQPDGILGVIGGLWTQAPNVSLTGCVYGILVKRTGGVTSLTEVVNGVANPSHAIEAQSTKSYVLRTNISSSSINRAQQTFNYMDSDGIVQAVGVPPPGYPDSFTFGTILSEIDLITGEISNGWPVYWTSNLSLGSGESTFANYVLVASQNLHLTVTGTTVYTPFQASLEVNPAVDTPTQNATITLTATVHSDSQVITGTVNFTYLGTPIGSAAVVNGTAVLVVSASSVDPTQDDDGVAGTFTPSGTTDPGTVTITVGPATSETFVSGAAGWRAELVGPNVVDGLDGLSPAATITQSGGITQKSTTLGTPKYQASSPTLAFFKNTNNLTSTTPQVGDQLKLKYRQAGAAVGHVRDAASVATEAQNWGDSGIRSVTKNNASPQPTTSAECEAAAAAVIFECGRPRFEGTYTAVSNFLQGEPLSGMALPFKNLPADQFESQNFAELIYQVKTTMLSRTPVEIYEHEISFGKATDELRVAQVLSAVFNQPDVFAPQDSAQVPDYVDPSSVGTACSPDLKFLEVSALSEDTITLTAPAALPAGNSIEVRSSDSGWGCDSGNNLIGRYSTQTFPLSRNAHNKACFAKMYDLRNIWEWSEDFTRMTATLPGAPLTAVQAANADGALAKLTQFIPNGSFPYVDFTSTTAAANSSGCFTLSVKGSAGTSFTLGAYANGSGLPVQQNTITCNGSWIRVSCPFSWSSGVTGDIYYRIAASAQVQVCHGSVELGTQVETVFCQTNGSPYGALSRYASAVRVNYPLTTPPPIGTLTFDDSQSPIVSLTLPEIALDVWGFEVRSLGTGGSGVGWGQSGWGAVWGDTGETSGQTVLIHEDVADVGPTPSLQLPATSSRNVTYYVYTYNLLGEYSDPLILQASVPTPTITSVAVSDATKMLEWATTDTDSVHLEIDTVDDTFTHKVVDTQVTDNFFQLSDADFFNPRWFRLTPSDSIGNGTPVTDQHEYIPDLLAELGSNEVGVIVMPVTSSGTPSVTVPAQFEKYANEYTDLALSAYRVNVSGA